MGSATIRPFNFGDLVGFEKSVFTLGRHQGAKVRAPCLGFVVDAGGKRVLWETGPCSPELARRVHGYTVEQPARPAEVLRSAGVEVGSIDAIVLSHLHWDHSYNLEQFPNVPIYVQRTELSYAVAPLPMHQIAYQVRVPGVIPPWAQALDRIVAIEGDVEIVPGIQTVLIPSHSPGSQGLAVRTDQGVYFLAGDAVALYENWKGTRRLRHVPSGVYVNLEDCFRSLEKIERIADVVIPSHDPAVLEHDVYPVGDE